MKYGFYSAEAAEKWGTYFYSHPDGTEIEVTCVDENDPEGKDYLWEDKICLGEVGEPLRKGREGNLEWMEKEHRRYWILDMMRSF